jgi:glycosyltransferase involved in cell wall biosynthesis
MTLGIVKPAMVTVLLSTFNGNKFLQQQLNSLYEQTYPDIRILVRDDGSSDSTRSILDGEHSKGRIDVLEKHNNLGPALSFFELLKSAALTETEYVAFCDQDDVWHPQKIAHAVLALAGVTGSCPAMYCSRAEIVDEYLEHIGYTEVPRKIGFGNALVENVAVGCTMVLNRKAIDLVCENLPSKLVIHDWWCYLVISCFGEIVFSNNSDIKYRQHGSNTIGIASNMIEQMNRKLRRFFGSAGGHLWISEQALSMLNIFKDSIPASKRQVLNNLVAAKSSWYRRLQLALSSDVWRQKWSDNLVLRLLILLNRF